MAKERSAYFDNAKFLLVSLVVIGHFVEGEMYRSGAGRLIFLFIYSFHIPAFAFIAGLMSGKRPGGYDAERAVGTLLLPYFCFQLLYGLASNAIKGIPLLELSPVRPIFAMWFLPSLFFWRAFVPLLGQRKSLLVAVFALGLVSGTLPHKSDFLGVERTLSFFPFFALGAFVPREALARFAIRWWRAGAAAVLLAAAVVLWLFGQHVDEKVLFGSKPYAMLGYGPFEGMGLRAAFYGMAGLLGACFLSLVPRRQLWFTSWGSRSMTIYLLHGFVSMVLMEKDYLASLLGISNPAVRVAVLVIGAVGVTLFLGLRPMHALFEPLCNVPPQRFAMTIAVLLALALGLKFVPSLRYPLAVSREASSLRLSQKCEQPLAVTARGVVVLDPGESRTRQLTVDGPQLEGLWVRAVVDDEECKAKPQAAAADKSRRVFSWSHCQKRGRLGALILGSSTGSSVRLCGLKVQ